MESLRIAGVECVLKERDRHWSAGINAFGGIGLAGGRTRDEIIALMKKIIDHHLLVEARSHYEQFVEPCLPP